MEEVYHIKPYNRDPRLDSFLSPYKLVNTSKVCPEAYSVFKENILVGHFRLKDGFFIAWNVENPPKIVYESDIGNTLGMFLNGEQRMQELKNAITALDNNILKK